MKIFLFDENTDGLIKDMCVDEGATVFELTAKESKRRSLQAVNYFLDQVDVLVVEMTDPSQMVHFVLAQAILANKPTLCLYQKNQPPRDILNYVRSRNTPRLMKTFSYTPATLQHSVSHFVHAFDSDSKEHDDIPSIKYTLRLTPRIDRYLEWMSTQQSKSKANVIRFVLSQIASEDEDYTEVKKDKR